ncbi:MAG: cysteine-rich CWC family protein [Rhodospirillaceae bacterium]|nr:cysteine-rich CWC family protein [Rhodospirillaceae bacterium]
MDTTCPTCGVAFTCGVDDRNTPCWCMAAPKIKPRPGATACLCPACLDAEIKRRAAAPDAPATSGP